MPGRVTTISTSRACTRPTASTASRVTRCTPASEYPSRSSSSPEAACALPATSMSPARSASRTPTRCTRASTGLAKLECSAPRHNPTGRRRARLGALESRRDRVSRMPHRQTRPVRVQPHTPRQPAAWAATSHTARSTMMLTLSVAQLCLECHSPTSSTTVGSRPPSLHDLRSLRYQTAPPANAVHGSNSSALLLR